MHSYCRRVYNREPLHKCNTSSIPLYLVPGPQPTRSLSPNLAPPTYHRGWDQGVYLKYNALGRGVFLYAHPRDVYQFYLWYTIGIVLLVINFICNTPLAQYYKY